MTQKSSRLIIQGRSGEAGRRYYFDIPFPNGHINMYRSEKGVAANLGDGSLGQANYFFTDPRPQFQDIPLRIKHVLAAMWRLTINRGRAVEPLIYSMGVRSHHLRVGLSQELPAKRVEEALMLLDQTVVKALGANLGHDGEDGYIWYNHPGPTVEVARLVENRMTSPFDPEGDRRYQLPPEVELTSLYMEYGVTRSWENLSLHDALRLPRHQIELLLGLVGVRGLDNITFQSAHGHKPAEVHLRKGLAWKWEVVEAQYHGALFETTRLVAA